MAWIPGARFSMGSDEFYPEEHPAHHVQVDGFWIDERPVTVDQFRRFVAATGYRTTAEDPPDPHDYPDADPELLVAGSLVFAPTSGPVNLDDFTRWGRYPANGFGLYDMIGNVWEWTDDWFGAHDGGDGCCLPANPRPELTNASYGDGERVPRKVIKGGSHLCAPNYCLRYRPAARQGPDGRHLDLAPGVPLRDPRTVNSPGPGDADPPTSP